jgi:hypothetical protein
MKERILDLLREMDDDSKLVSYRAEKELCGILTDVINQLREIANALGYPTHNYPDKIDAVDECDWYGGLPTYIECNYGDFTFVTEWLDIDLQKRFNDMKANRINSITTTIAHIEHSLAEHKKYLERITELKFEDLEI